MSPPEPEPLFAWGVGQTRAARLVAEDVLSDEEIAAACSVTKRTLERWKLRPAFAARVAHIRAEILAAEIAGGIASRAQRVAILDERHGRLRQLVDERAADPQMRKVAGGITGYVAHEIKMIGGGENAERVDEYPVDKALLDAFLAIEKQAAQELGQWTEKREITGKDGGPITVIEVAPPAPRSDETGE